MSQSKRENYHILSLIGKGAYGQVYKARKKNTGQFVAIKTIKKKGKQEKDIKAMRQEIQILKKLNHENIVLLLDSFETSSEFIIVTQLGQGQLFNIIEDDQYLQQTQIRKVAQQLIRALHYLHSNRIMHRDLKPQNILMTSDGNIKLCDFGFARHMSYRTEVLTSLKGTPLYMAPQVVEERPYTHTADLWSLGVILYELSTGSPPFSAPNLLQLVDHISKDPVRYPDVITGDFKTLLKGLLNKNPNSRLGWPDLLNHPYIRESQQQKLNRKKNSDMLSYWRQENHHSNEDSEQPENPNFPSYKSGGTPKKQSSVSPIKGVSCNDANWNNYLKIANDENGASKLRSDSQFLTDLLDILSKNINDLMRNKDQKNILQCALKVLTQVLMKSKTPNQKSLDISKKLSIPNFLLNILKNLIKVEGGRNFVQNISDITKLIGLLSKITFNKTLGIQMVYIRSFLPLLPNLIGCAITSTDSPHQTLVINLLRSIGIFANNASVHHLRSFSFYKDIIEIKFMTECVSLLKVYESHLNVLKLLVQVLSAFMHPVYGDIECFPWKKQNSYGVLEYKECSTMLQCVRQSIINSLMQIDWMVPFQKILDLDDESSVLPKISIQRIILQAIRQSKQFTENLLSRPNPILKYIFFTLSNTDPIIYGTTCLIIGHLLKFCKEKKKQKLLLDYEYLTAQIIALILNKITYFNTVKNNGNLGVYGSMIILQQLILMQAYPISKISEFFLREKNMKFLYDYLGSSQKSKLQDMRKLQGSNYGIHLIGFYDPVFLFLHKFQIYFQKQSKGSSSAQLFRAVSAAQIQVRMSQIVQKISPKTDLSPRGLIALLMFIYDILSFKVCSEFSDANFLRNLISLLSESQLDCLGQWPIQFGGGQNCIQILFGNLMKIFLMYLNEGEKEVQIIKTIYQNSLIELVIQFTRFLNSESINSVVTFMGHLIAFNTQKYSFVRQFIESSGMAIFVRFNLLKKQTYDDSSIVEALNLLSQVARSSKQTYQHIDSIDPYSDIKILIKSNDAQIKSRVLNLIGNLCRHSGYFYSKLLEFDLIKDIIHLCSCEDKSIKKFACVALGNASFHDSTLYDSLKIAMPTLVNLLKDSDEKTRSNAAAALGNLARNSHILDKEFVKTGANYQLVNMIQNDKSISAKKVSIMAVTNLLNLPQSSKLLLELNISTILKKYLPPTYNGDQNLIKTAQKALEKIKQ